MENEIGVSEWNKPLSKGDFFLFQIEKSEDFYSTLCIFTFLIGFVSVITAVIRFYQKGEFLLWLGAIILAVLSFIFAVAAGRRFSSLKESRMKIIEEMQTDV